MRVLLAIGLTLIGIGCERSPGATSPEPRASVPVLDRAALDEAVRDVLDEAEPGTELSVWVGPPTGEPWYEHNVDVSHPAASAIKTAYLVELFDAYAGHLDEPLEGIDSVLAPTHPAVVHFDAGQRDEITRDLADATVREIAHHMIRGSRVSNVVYNAAANVTTAILGGPDGLTRRIHDRAPAFAGLMVRRYMLAARDVTGDNEATASGLAAVLRSIAARDVPGATPDTLDAMRDILAVEDLSGPDRHFFKSGSLNSDPLTRIASGFWETPAGIFVYVVMAERPDPGSLDRAEAGRRLQGTVGRVSERVAAAARHALAQL